jgi:hypothetical protein
VVASDKQVRQEALLDLKGFNVLGWLEGKN